MTAKRVLVGVVGVFVAVLAVIIGQRMSTDAMAVVIGVIFGVAASIPTSLLIVAVTRRAQERALGEREVYRERAQPPVIVVNPGGGTVSPWFTPFGQPMLPPTMEGEPTRRFHVVGEEDGVLNAEPWPRRS
jgi:anti-sigma factor RsiW